MVRRGAKFPGKRWAPPRSRRRWLRSVPGRAPGDRSNCGHAQASVNETVEKPHVNYALVADWKGDPYETVCYACGQGT